MDDLLGLIGLLPPEVIRETLRESPELAKEYVRAEIAGQLKLSLLDARGGMWNTMLLLTTQPPLGLCAMLLGILIGGFVCATLLRGWKRRHIAAFALLAVAVAGANVVVFFGQAYEETEVDAIACGHRCFQHWHSVDKGQCEFIPQPTLGPFHYCLCSEFKSNWAKLFEAILDKNERCGFMRGLALLNCDRCPTHLHADMCLASHSYIAEYCSDVGGHKGIQSIAQMDNDDFDMIRDIMLMNEPGVNDLNITFALGDWTEIWHVMRLVARGDWTFDAIVRYSTHLTRWYINAMVVPVTTTDSSMALTAIGFSWAVYLCAIVAPVILVLRVANGVAGDHEHAD